MANLIELAKQNADTLLQKAYVAAAASGALPEGAELSGSVEIPKDVTNGDYAANHAMVCARALKMPPRRIAEALTEHCDLSGSYFSSVSVAGPGFINFRLSERWYSAVLDAVRAEADRYGRVSDGSGRKVMVEFVSANPTGPMHLGNARGGVLGDSLASVLDFAGWEVSREFYVNDAGNQIEKFASSIDARYHELLLGDKAPEFPEDGYHGEDIIELAKAFLAQEGDGWLQKPEAERHAAMAQFGLARNIPKMKADLLRYGVEYDRWFCESELHESGFVKETVDRLTDLGYTYEKDGALWLRTAEIIGSRLMEEGKSLEAIAKLDLKDDVLRRSNGFYTYFAADIAYHRNKLEVRGYDLAINIWGADHHGHVARLKGAMDALGLDGQHRLDIVLMQLVKLMRDGRPEKMSKRTGKAISLTDLLDEVPVDAARYFFNSRPDSPVEFDLDLAVRQDSENPVYYVQYAHARICTLIAALAEQGHSLEDAAGADTALLTVPEEQELIKQLAALPEEVRLAARDYDPSRINRYVTELATRFHKFYTVCRIRDAEPGILEARLQLCAAVRQVLEIALGLIGVSAPEHM
ncbi:MAG: arginine--tRNA ligase [Oscillospiraceae bacterium]|nr:arginine--tRNA ligase [Oscillospiraceae bacterium]